MRLYTNCRPKFLLPAVLLLTCGTALAQSPTYKVGRAPTAEELRTWDNLVGPDGKELPAGKGTAQEGAAIFAARCAMCHGQDGVGNWPYARLTGGVGTLNTPNPIKTPASNMPYATTIFDFIQRAMPAWPMPRNLTPDNVYALTAFILAKSGIIKDTDVMDKNSLVEVQMPNRHGFYPDPPQDNPDDEDGTWLPLWEHASQPAIASSGDRAVPAGGGTLGNSFVVEDAGGTPDNNPEVMAADHSFVLALAHGDSQTVQKLLDGDCLWTNSAGDTIERAKLAAALPKNPLGDESGAQVSERTYGAAGAVQVASGNVHILRIWVKRPAGWRLLDFHEVAQRTGPAPPPGPTTNDCENPCKGVPYAPKNEAEKGILKSWGELETAVTNHNPQGWAPHFLDEFVLISSNASDPAPKSARLEQLAKPGFGPAPPQLAADPPVRFFHFGDTVVMIAQANPYSGKPAHISRIWVNRGGMWRMAFSYQTTIQSAAPMVPPAS